MCQRNHLNDRKTNTEPSAFRQRNGVIQRSSRHEKLLDEIREGLARRLDTCLRGNELRAAIQITRIAGPLQLGTVAPAGHEGLKLRLNHGIENSHFRAMTLTRGG